jgi:acyl carrier protein
MIDDRLVQCFVRALGLSADRVTADLAYNAIREWDSVGHMALVAELEGTFDLMLDTDEILGLSSVAKAVELLQKHGVALAA